MFMPQERIKLMMEDSFYDQPEREFDKSPKCHIKILLGELNAKVSKEDVFKPTFRNENLYKISNNNGVRIH
jgi:hypothetical protein